MPARKDRDYDPDEDQHPEVEHQLAIRAARLGLKKGFTVEQVCRMHGVKPEELKKK